MQIFGLLKSRAGLLIAVLTLVAVAVWVVPRLDSGNTSVYAAIGPPAAEAADSAYLPTALGTAEATFESTTTTILDASGGSGSIFSATLGDVAGTTGINDHLFGASATYDGVLPFASAVTLAAVAVTFLALWYVYRLARRSSTTGATVGSDGDDGTILGVYGSLMSKLRTAMGRVAKISTLGFPNTFVTTAAPTPA